MGTYYDVVVGILVVFVGFLHKPFPHMIFKLFFRDSIYKFIFQWSIKIAKNCFKRTRWHGRKRLNINKKKQESHIIVILRSSVYVITMRLYVGVLLFVQQPTNKQTNTIQLYANVM